MRNMSFALTKPQMQSRTKTVTRRLGWDFLKPGDLLQPVEKCQGLKKGETIQKIGGPIRVLCVDRRKLSQINAYDCANEGFPLMSPAEFIDMFCRTHRVVTPKDGTGSWHRSESRPCRADDTVTRIMFEFVE